MMNWRKIKKTHKKARGNTAVFNFLMTMNLMTAPATKTAMKLLTIHASGKTIISITPSTRVRAIDSPMMRGVLLKQMVKISMKYMVETPREKTMTTQKVTSSESSMYA